MYFEAIDAEKMASQWTDVVRGVSWFSIRMTTGSLTWI